MTIKQKRGNTAKSNNYTGADGSISVDNQKGELRVHNGTKQGGFRLPNEDGVRSLSKQTTGTEVSKKSGKTFSHKSNGKAVGFHYALGSTGDVGSGNSIPFDTAMTPSDFFNTTYGSFTAPVTGLYFFSTNILRDGGASPSGLEQFWISVEGAEASASPATGSTSQTPTFSYSISAVLQLTEGEVVTVRSTGTKVNGSYNASYFTGFLL